MLIDSTLTTHISEIRSANYYGLPQGKLQSLCLGLALSRRLRIPEIPDTTPSQAYVQTIGGSFMTNESITGALSIVLDYLPGLDERVIEETTQNGWYMRYETVHPGKYIQPASQAAVVSNLFECFYGADRYFAPEQRVLLGTKLSLTIHLINCFTDVLDQIVEVRRRAQLTAT